MKILAFLQNQWFHDPARMEQIYARHGATPEKRAELNAAYLFAGCTTGKRLAAAFGDEMCDRIIWENASPRMAGVSSGAFPPDPKHIRRTFLHFEPRIVLLFGKVAQDGWSAALKSGDWGGSDNIPAIVLAPHPAARHATVMDELRRAAKDVRASLWLAGEVETLQA